MIEYLNLLTDVLENGDHRMDRTGTGARSVFGRQIRFDLLDSLPVVTTKKIHLKSIKHELVWFLRGDTNIQYLQDNGVRIWNEWADPEGNLGPVYGEQWRRYRGVNSVGELACVDQMAELLKSLIKNPYGRRHIISAWNVTQLAEMKLPPCHCLFQFFVSKASDMELREAAGFDAREPMENVREWCDFNEVPQLKLSCQLYQRSCDLFLGVPFNIASYAMLTGWVAKQCGYLPGDFVHTFGDLHIYDNHIDQVKMQLGRKPMPLPSLRVAGRSVAMLEPEQRLEMALGALDTVKFDDFEVVGYESHPTIKGDVAV